MVTFAKAHLRLENCANGNFLQNTDTVMTSQGADWGTLFGRSSVWEGLPRNTDQDRRLHALRHREDMGKNRRPYRRGYGCRFVFAFVAMYGAPPRVLASALAMLLVLESWSCVSKELLATYSGKR